MDVGCHKGIHCEKLKILLKYNEHSVRQIFPANKNIFQTCIKLTIRPLIPFRITTKEIAIIS